jgi:hypothetical protein
MTPIQQSTQCDGPWRPTAERMSFILSTLPRHLEVRAISIKGQGGKVVVETYHEGLDLIHEFDLERMERSSRPNVL